MLASEHPSEITESPWLDARRAIWTLVRAPGAGGVGGGRACAWGAKAAAWPGVRGRQAPVDPFLPPPLSPLPLHHPQALAKAYFWAALESGTRLVVQTDPLPSQTHSW
jgi:hypothetical protein